MSTRAEDATTAKIISNSPKEYPKRSPVGVYDQFVCCEHEKLFQEWDDYALAFFKTAYKSPCELSNGRVLLNNYDYKKLKLYFLSLLWRADASLNQSMYKPVDVGEKHRKCLDNLILTGDAGNWQEYAITLERFAGNRPAISFIRSPRKAKLKNINFYTFYMAGFRVHIKYDQENVPDKMKDEFINESRKVLVSIVNFETSLEKEENIQSINMSHNQTTFSST